MNRRLRLSPLVCLVLVSASLMQAQGPPSGANAPSPEMVTPGELRHRAADADQSRLRVVHPGRRQPQRERSQVSYRKKGDTRVEAGAAAAAPAGRAHLRASRASTSSRPTCSRAASSISSRTRRTKRAS